MIKKVRMTMLLYIDDDRDIDLADTSNWNVVLLDTKTGTLIFDVDLDRYGEQSFNPKLRFLN
jgi:hypothetical protein